MSASHIFTRAMSALRPLLGVLLLALLSCSSEVKLAGEGDGAANDGDDASASGSDEPYRCDDPTGRGVREMELIGETLIVLLTDGTLWCSGGWGDGLCPYAYDETVELTDYPCLRTFDAEGDALIAIAEDGGIWAATSDNGQVPGRIADGPADWVTATPGVVAWGKNGNAWWWGNVWWIPDTPVEPSPFPWGPIDGLTVDGLSGCFWREGRARCWGDNEWGQLGDGTTSPYGTFIDEPVDVNIPPVTYVELSGLAAYAIDEAGSVWTWGLQEHTEDGAPAAGPTPHLVDGVNAAIGLVHDSSSTCAWSAEGEVTCWGWNNGGLSAIGPPPWDDWIPPTRRPDLEPAVDVDTDNQWPLCALKEDHTVWCRQEYPDGSDQSEKWDLAPAL